LAEANAELAAAQEKLSTIKQKVAVSVLRSILFYFVSYPLGLDIAIV
jgi:hypothetical protein